MSFRNRFITVLEGWLLLLFFSCLVFTLLFPKALNIVRSHTDISETSERIDDYSERVFTAPTESKHQGYRSFVFNQPTELDLKTFQGSIQSSIIQTVKRSKTRLADLRALDSDESIGHLTATKFSLEVDGDLEGVLDVLHGLSKLEEPLLLTEMSLKSNHINERADKNLRLSMTIKLWTQRGES